jgi:hypothetical protein
MTLSLVAKSEIVVPFTEIESKILELVIHHQGIKEMELWLFALAELGSKPSDTPTISVISNAIHRMIQQGRLIGIDYAIGDITNTFVLPVSARPVVLMPIGVIQEMESAVL